MKKFKKVAALLLVVSLVAMSGLLAYANVDPVPVQTEPELTATEILQDSSNGTSQPGEAPQVPVQEPENAARIGETEYATLDEAVAAAADGATIELLKDCTTEGLNLSKDLTIKAAENVGKPTITFSQYGIALWGKSLTFENCTVVMNGIGSTPYTAEWNWMTICANKDASLNLNNVTMTMDGTGTAQTDKATHAIYFCSNNKLNLTDSTLEIRNYKQDALEWDGGDGGYNVNLKDSTFVSDNNRSGFTGTFYATIDNSNVDVINSTGNGSNGSYFDIKNGSVVNFKDNKDHGLSAAKLTIDNSTVNAIGNGANGIHATDTLEIKNHSTVFVRENRCAISSKWTIPGAVYVGGNGSSIDDTCTVEITDNKGSGIYVKENASLDMKVGTVVRNTAVKLEQGGGINNHGVVILGDGVQLYNNHADTAGDDIYNAENASITFGSTGSDWELDGVPAHCTDAITGWFDDAEGNRWSAHGSKPYHVDEFTQYGTAVTGIKALKAAHGLLPVDETSGDWQISKSKEATNLDSNGVSNVTLSLPSAQEALSTDVVFVLDKSTSAEVEEQIIGMLQSLKEQVKKTDATVNVGVVIFNKVANKVCELTALTDENLPAIEAAIKTEIKRGTNLHAGLLAGKAMLDEDTATAASHKYLITVSDGITYMFGKEPTAVSWSWIGDTELRFAGPDNWKAKYGTEDAPAEGWSSWLANMAEKAQVTDFDYPYGGTATQSTPAADKMNYANSIDKALYLSNEVYQAAEAEGYHCYATTAKQKEGQQYLWGPSFMNYLACGKDVSFAQIQKEIYYLLDAGSYVIDKIGKTGDYDFDFCNPENMILKVGDKVYKAQKAADETNVYYFGEPRNRVYPYVVRYYPESENNPEEYFKWEINVPVSNLERVSLTYSVKLTNPKTAAGTYGEYDRYGENNKASLYTNNEAILYPVDSNGQKGMPEYFKKPTVSYTVGGSTPIIPSTKSITVQKIWTLDDGGSAAEFVTVQLLRNGQPDGNPVTLNEANQWKYTWYGRDYGVTYTVEELNVPEGFTSTVTEKAYNWFTIVNDDVKAEDPAVKPDDGDGDTNTPDTPDKPDDPSEPSPSEDADIPVKPDEPQTDVPKTEDNQNGPFWFGLMAVALVGAGTTLKLARKLK